MKENQASLADYLTQEKTHLSLSIQQINEYDLPKNKKQYESKRLQLNTMLTLNQAKIQSLDGFLDNQNKQQVRLSQKLKYLKQLPLLNSGTSLQEQVKGIEHFIAESRKTSSLIQDNLKLTYALNELLKEKIKELNQWHEHFLLEQQLWHIKSEKAELNKQLHAMYQKNKEPTVHAKRHKDREEGRLEQEERLLINSQTIALIHQQLHLLTIQKMAIQSNMALAASYDSKTLQRVTDEYKEYLKQMDGISLVLQKMQSTLSQERSLITDNSVQKAWRSLNKELGLSMDALNAQKRNFSLYLQDCQLKLKKLISSRQSLLEYNARSWSNNINKLAAIPSLLSLYLKTLALKVYDSYKWLDKLPRVLLWICSFLIVAFSFSLSRFLKRVHIDKERSRLSGYLYDGALTILQRNIPYLCCFALLWFIFYMTNIAYANYQLLFNLLTLWITFRILILIARLVLLLRVTDESGNDVRLYYRLKWLLLFGGWVTALMTFSHILPLPLMLQDLFSRLFMLFILALSLVAWNSRDVIPYLLRPILKYKKKYFKNAVSLLVVLVPMTLFTTAIVGLFGLVDLAWTMSRYQVNLLLVVVGFILARGLVFDALDLLSEWMIASLKNGWLWVEVFLKPLDKILRVVLFLFSTWVLFQLFDWHSDSYVMVWLGKLATYSVINITGVHITVASIVEFFILLSLFIWASKWTREFCYRWLYRKTKDAGIRNSLSVFTQYAVILLGAFITLHVLGLDFSGMSMILGGLAVGMGFGLRDFANNIVGGIMLLIERPVREGDLITLGEYEGRVAHIGIRSMRVSSWDNMEVLIPNAETFNKPFTNWTHQDSIVRTVVPIKVSRADDPQMVQQLIADVLAITPEIVDNPPTQVLLKGIDEALIEFEVRYFINVQTHTRVEVRSKVLFAITAQFKAAGIKPPIQPIAVEFKEEDGEHIKGLPTKD